MCSSKCETPIFGRSSCALAVRTQTPIATERTLGSRSLSTVTPLGAAVRWISRSRRTVSSVGATGGGLVLLDQRFPRQPHATALVHLEQLHLQMVALFDDILRLFGPTVLQLGDVEQPLDSRDDLDERAEGGRALHDALVDLPHLGLLDDARHHAARPSGAI